tara:strand:+ start:78 stop:560 length:483 start_codon:yes stop_codon:yes gene_type:complete
MEKLLKLKKIKNKKDLKEIKDFIEMHVDWKIDCKRRNAKSVMFRTLFFYLSIKTTNLTLKEIGKFIKRDHSTVVHHKDNLFKKLESNEVMIILINKFYKIKSKETKKLETLLVRNFGEPRLTNIEKQYRKLNTNQKIEYNKMASILIYNLRNKLNYENIL